MLTKQINHFYKLHCREKFSLFEKVNSFQALKKCFSSLMNVSTMCMFMTTDFSLFITAGLTPSPVPAALAGHASYKFRLNALIWKTAYVQNYL